ncbi:MAG: hypothetical protein AAFO01_05085 [Pseudomonadota bacterium]
MIGGAKQALLIAAIVGVAMGISGCREDEQGRPMVKQKGLYEGQPDETLSEDTRSALRARTEGQKF